MKLAPSLSPFNLSTYGTYRPRPNSWTKRLDEMPNYMPNTFISSDIIGFSVCLVCLMAELKSPLQLNITDFHKFIYLLFCSKPAIMLLKSKHIQRAARRIPFGWFQISWVLMFQKPLSQQGYWRASVTILI